MYSVPSSVAERVQREFNGRLRIRFSDKKRAFQVEARTHRGLSDIPLPENVPSDVAAKLKAVFYDDLQRARDGYSLVMEVQPGDRMPCPNCHMELKVPHRKTAEVNCEYCRVMGRDGRTTAGYWPLDSESFFERLRYLDPQRGYRRSGKQVDEANKRRQEIEEKDALNLLQSVNRDEYRNFAGILQTGTTTKNSAWTNAPESPLLKALR